MKLFCNPATGHRVGVKRFFVVVIIIFFFFLSSFSSGDHFVQQSGTILTIVVKGDKKNISAKSF